MSRYEADGTRSATNLFEAAAWHMSIRVTCRRCGRSQTFNPHGLWWRFRKKSWDDTLRHVPERLACSSCRDDQGRPTRRPRLELVKWSADDICLPMPDEREWKRAVSRFRS